MSVFQKVYPFATENVKDSLEKLDLKGKNVLTVGSSLDQTFDAVLYGASHVTVFDINANVKKFYEAKKELLTEVSRRQFYDEILKKDFIYDAVTEKSMVYRNCKYLESDESYKLLKKKSESASVSFVTGDIFDIDSYLDKTKKYDCILLSNVMQYIDYFAPNKKEVYSFFREKFLEIEKHLNDEGILELYYLYSIFQNRKLVLDSSLPIYNLRKIYECLEDKSLYIEGIPSIHPNNEIMDAILTYKKR